jgi:fatty-acyl-CoA synthase
VRRDPVLRYDSRVFNHDAKRECGPNEVGEIITHGPQVFRGYWKQPQATEAAFMEHDGKRFFRTGDLGYYDEEGYFFITDRLKRMINASGSRSGRPRSRRCCMRTPTSRRRASSARAIRIAARP